MIGLLVLVVVICWLVGAFFFFVPTQNGRIKRGKTVGTEGKFTASVEIHAPVTSQIRTALLAQEAFVDRVGTRFNS